MNILGKRSDLPFSRKNDRKKEKGTVSFTHEQNIICSQTLLDGIAHEQTIICRQLFAGHMVGSRPMKRKNNLLRMIIMFVPTKSFYFFVNRFDTNIRIIQTPWHLPLVSILAVSTAQEFLNWSHVHSDIGISGFLPWITSSSSSMGLLSSVLEIILDFRLAVLEPLRSVPNFLRYNCGTQPSLPRYLMKTVSILY